MDKKLILDFIKNNGHAITKETEILVQQLTEHIEAQKQNLEDIDTTLAWLEEKKQSYAVDTKEIAVKDLDKWYIDLDTYNLRHESGKFFSVIGIKVDDARGREVISWTQPMLKQNECGILGILCKRINGVTHYLLQAKYEPGSIASLQLAPTLQATASNLSLVHGGKKTLFAEYFEGNGKGKVLTSVIQVEDPSRFYHKTNRCMIIEIDENEDIKIPEDFIWLTLPQLKKLLEVDNVINALARCVLASR